MMKLNSIRHRLVMAAFALSWVVAGIFVGGLYFAFDTAEDKLFDNHLNADVDAFLAIYQRDPSVIDLPHRNLRVFVSEEGRGETLPAFLWGLPADADEVFIDGREHELQVRRSGSQTLYFLIDESEFEEFEQSLVSAMAIIITIVIGGSAWAGAAIADRIVRPLTELSRQVAALGSGASSHIALDASAQADDEIVSLAQVINGYHLRLTELLQREREFSADVSHELRTPIMAVQGAADVLQRKLHDDVETCELVARVRRGCTRMATLTEALLFLARDPESFRDMVEPVAIKSVIDEQVSAVRDLAENKGVRLQVDGSVNTTIRAIPAVIEIVLGNILKNAVKYTDHDVIKIFVGEQKVVIQDYGPGIDQALQAQLFERFERGLNRSADGNGIGLALVRRFCEQYGWQVDFHSNHETGTRVALVF